ncbi:hypothetical protein CVM52_23655 [Pseudooceanicola lipolyticus]|uniref:LysE family translocator n=1 Tax=Pseudooceanicola lipolyticus TaxID=2029104 RepID=A0A2M8IUH6_9RHOB|nr:hypothetical protein [Pseudooceanicola lipolyticus]PJE34176.1 hypothetical protein CVM52_23655 [Pseudooceanicola lipolyticus]
MIDDLPNLFLAWSIQFTGVVSPGPGVALILGIATAQGRGAALRCCLGIGLGGLLLAALTVFGLAALLAEWRGAMIAAPARTSINTPSLLATPPVSTRISA